MSVHTGDNPFTQFELIIKSYSVSVPFASQPRGFISFFESAYNHVGD